MTPNDPFSPPPSFETEFLKSLIPRKKTLIVLIAVLAGLAAGIPLALYSYNKASSSRMTSVAVKALKEKKIKEAVDMLQKALKRDPGNEAAVRLMCDISHKLKSTEATRWYERLHTLRPEFSIFDSWIRVALENKQSTLARQALENNRSRYAKVPEFHTFDSIVHVSNGNIPAATKAMEEALSLKDLPEWRVSLNSLRLLNPKQTVRQEAESALMAVESPPQLLIQSRIAVMEFRQNRRDLPGAALIAEKVWDKPELTDAQRYSCLRVLAASRSNATSRLVETILVKKESPQQWSQSVKLISEAGAGKQVLLWWEKQDAAFQKEPLHALAAATLYLKQGNIAGFSGAMNGVHWGSATYIPALAQDVVSPRKDSLDFWRAWANSKNTPQAFVLHASVLAKEWNVDSARESILWELSKVESMGPEPLRDIYLMYRKRSDTAGLYRISQIYQNRYPEDPVGINNRARQGLLLGIEVQRCREMAVENQKNHPDFPGASATLGLSLLLENKVNEALALIEKLSPDQQRQPDIAFYHALFLRAQGKQHDALALIPAEMLSVVLPEEKVLWDRYNGTTSSGPSK